MNKTLKTALAATLVLGATQAAHADLTYQGAVGLPLNPTAQIPLPNGVRIQGDYFDLGREAGTGSKRDRFYGLHAAGRLGGDLEINGGVDKLSASDPIGKTGISIGAKYLFTRESDPAGVRLAAGVGYSSALLKNTYGYVVATKYLGEVKEGRIPVTGHLGIRYDHFKVPDGGDTSNKASIYGGVEVPVTRTGDFTFVGELQSKNNDFGNEKIPYSASIRYRTPGKGISASLGVARQGLTRSGVFFQLGYSFDTGQVTGG